MDTAILFWAWFCVALVLGAALAWFWVSDMLRDLWRDE